MEKITDIFIDCAEFLCDYSDNERVTGRIIIGEDNFFEGVARNKKHNHNYFIFGNITDEDEINLVRCSEDDEEIPRIMVVKRNGHGYEGNYQAKNEYTIIPLGDSRITLLPAEITREETDWEKKQVKMGIIKMKHRLGAIGNQAHESFEYARLNQSKNTKKIQKTQNI